VLDGYSPCDFLLGNPQEMEDRMVKKEDWHQVDENSLVMKVIGKTHFKHTQTKQYEAIGYLKTKGQIWPDMWQGNSIEKCIRSEEKCSAEFLLANLLQQDTFMSRNVLKQVLALFYDQSNLPYMPDSVWDALSSGPYALSFEQQILKGQHHDHVHEHHQTGRHHHDMNFCGLIENHGNQYKLKNYSLDFRNLFLQQKIV